MSFPRLERGNLLQIFYGDGATPTELFTLLCIASTKSFKRTQDTEDHFEIDCASPDSLPQRISTPKSATWELSISGRADFAKFHILEGWLDSSAHNVQIKLSETGTNGGGTYTGAVVLTALDLTTSDNATVTFAATFKGTGGAPTWLAAP